MLDFLASQTSFSEHGNRSSYALTPSDYVDARVLAASVAKQHTIPTGANWVVFSSDSDFYAKFGTNPTAAIPAADVTDGTSSVLNPTVRYVNGVAKISLIAAIATVVTMEFYS